MYTCEGKSGVGGARLNLAGSLFRFLSVQSGFVSPSLKSYLVREETLSE